MPFKSNQQRKFMYATHPKIAKRWTEETTQKNLTEKKTKKKGKKYFSA